MAFCKARLVSLFVCEFANKYHHTQQSRLCSHGHRSDRAGFLYDLITNVFTDAFTHVFTNVSVWYKLSSLFYQIVYPFALL